MKNLKTIFKTRTAKALSILTTVGIIASTGMALAGWTPHRPVFDFQNPAQREGSFDGPRMNAYINTNVYGDERAFFDARRTDQTSQTAYKDVLQYPTQGSKQVILRTYVHNAAHPSTNVGGLGVARNTRVRITLPSGTEKALRARSYISIDNPAPGYPGIVTDTTELVDSTPFAINYVPGSARIYNVAHPGGLQISDTVVGDGAVIGYDEMNGIMPGCFEFQAMVEITVNVVTPDVQLEKQVRKAGTSTYGEATTVNPGDKVEWIVKVQNKGEARVEDVNVIDRLPAHLKVVPGSVRWIYRAQDGTDKNVQQSDTDLFKNWVDFGNWTSGGGFYLRFDTIALDDFEECEVKLRNIVYQRNKQFPDEIRDHADVTIVKEDCVEEEPPKEEEPKKQVPKVLPDTGMGSVVGIFAATTTAGATAHYFISRRRF